MQDVIVIGAGPSGLAALKEMLTHDLSVTAIERSAGAIARLCADLQAIFGLDRIAVGGSVGLAQGYLPRILDHLSGEPPLFQVELVPAELGHDSALLGALLPEGPRE